MKYTTPPPGLQRRHVPVEIHPVNRFQFEGDVMVEDLSDTFAYHRLELPESAAHVATDPKRVYYLGAGFNPCLLPGLHFSNEALPQADCSRRRTPQHARRSEAGPRTIT